MRSRYPSTMGYTRQTSSTVGDLLEHSGRREGLAAVVLLAPHCEGLPTIDGQSLPVPVTTAPLEWSRTLVGCA